MSTNMNQATNPREGLPSASSMHRVAACPGSVALEAQCPETENDDSKAGTLMHKAIAGETVELDDKMRDTVDMCESLTGQIVNHHGFAHIKPVIEQRHWWIEDGQKRFSGQFDRAYVDQENSRALVIDYKMLFGDHDEAAENWQLRTLAMLVSNSFGVSHIIVALVQPWVKGQFTLAEYGPQELIEAKDRILAAVKASKYAHSLRIPGDHCKFCRGLAICPEAQAEAVITVGQVTAVLGGSVRTIDTYTPQERGEMINWIARAEGALEARKKELKEFEMKNPGSIEGWHLKPGNEVRSVENVSKFFWALKENLGVTMEDFLAQAKVSFGWVKPIYKAKTGIAGKAGDLAFKEFMKPLVTVNQNKPSLEKL